MSTTVPQKHVIVTGGAGFIGSHLVERLLADGKSVVVIDDLSTGSLENLHAVKKHPQLRVIQSRVSDCSELTQLASRAESIYHLAAAVGVELVLKEPIRCIKTNLHETEAILEAASAYQVPILLTSSSEVYGKSQKESFSEDDDLIIGPPTQLRWSYACSKLMDEFMAMAYAHERALPVIIARLFNVVGPRQTGRYGMVLPRFIEAAMAGKPLRVYGDGKQTRCFCWVGDVVEALARLVAQPAAFGKIFNVGGTDETQIRALAYRVCEILECPVCVEFVGFKQAYTADFEDFHRRKPNTQKLQHIVNFQPNLSIETIVRQIQELRKEGASNEAP